MKAFKIVDDLVMDVSGRIGIPILLYLLGVPGLLVILLWLFFFRGR